MGNMYSEDNEFQFVCPVFDAKTKMAACSKLLSIYYKGENFDKRRGCQACMSSGKCPVLKMHQSVWQTKYDTSVYFSRTPTTGKLGQDILDSVARVVVLDSTISSFRVPVAEISLIETSGDRIAGAIASAPAKRKSIKASYEKQSKLANSAAQTGDMSAAINRGGA